MTNNPVRNVMSRIDEYKSSLPEGVYLEICNELKKIYATGDTARDTYLLNLTNDYLEGLEIIDTLRREILNLKRELLRVRVSRFEDVSRPVGQNRQSLFEPRSVLETLIFGNNRERDGEQRNTTTTDNNNTNNYGISLIPRWTVPNRG